MAVLGESSNRKSQIANRQFFAWQGWAMQLPARWNPVKLEGDYDAGQALIADMHRPRLGIRWKRAGKRFDADAWAERAMREEVGRLAAAKGKPFLMPSDVWVGSRIFLEAEPPGRDVWVAMSRASGRVIEIVHHVHRRDRMLEEVVLPGLGDAEGDQAQVWSVFDLSCAVPAGYRLTMHRLNAGDLMLSFRSDWQMLTVRQIALAGMALSRMPLEKWLANQERAMEKRYRPTGNAAEVSVGAMTGFSRTSTRRRRFGFMRWIAAEVLTYALHDEARDRLVIVQGSDDAALRQVAQSMAGQ